MHKNAAFNGLGKAFSKGMQQFWLDILPDAVNR